MLCIIYILILFILLGGFTYGPKWTWIWMWLSIGVQKEGPYPRFFGLEPSGNQVNRGPLISPSVGYILWNPITAYRYVTLVKKINRRILAIEKEILLKLTRKLIVIKFCILKYLKAKLHLLEPIIYSEVTFSFRRQVRIVLIECKHPYPFCRSDLFEVKLQYRCIASYKLDAKIHILFPDRVVSVRPISILLLSVTQCLYM